MITEPMVVVNGFVFCKKHGDEYCHRCFYDHRFTNNYVIMEESALRDIGDKGVYSMDNRESINVYELGAIQIGNEVSKDCKCRKHGLKDCNTYFNWVEYFLEQVMEAEYRAKWLKKERYYRNRDD